MMSVRYLLTKAAFSLLLATAIPQQTYAETLGADSVEESTSVLKGGGRPSQEIRKQARAGDPAEAYVLKQNQRFYRVFSGKLYWLDDRVEDFKISQHPADAAYVYYIRKGNLKVMDQGERQYQIEEGIKHDTGSGRYKYNVIPSDQSLIVNTALTVKGKFIAWGNTKVLYSSERAQLGPIKDYRINPGFASGKPFSSYVVFLIDYNGFVTKIRGKNPEDSKTDYSRSYHDLKEFMKVNDIH